MSIASEITALNNNLEAAKAAIEAAGGTVGDTGLAGLATEVESIPSGGGGEPTITGYGRLDYYLKTKIEFTLFFENCEGEIADEEVLESWWESADRVDSIYYDTNEQGGWYYYAPDTGDVVVIDDIASTGLSITLPAGTEWAMVMLRAEEKPDISAGKGSIDLSAEDFDVLHNLDNYWDTPVPIGGIEIPRVALCKYSFGPAVTAVGNNFLSGVEYLNPNFECDTLWGTNVVTIGNNCSFRRCGVFFFPKLQSIGSSCNIRCDMVDLPALTTIGDGFYCEVNDNLYLPEVTAIGNNFKTTAKDNVICNKCTTVGNGFSAQYATVVQFPEATSLGSNFLRGESGIHKRGSGRVAISIPKVVTIGNYFLADTPYSEVTMTLPSTLTSIGGYFMYRCTNLRGGYWNYDASQITCECPASVLKGDVQYCLTTDSFAPSRNLLGTTSLYACGIAFLGRYKAEWAAALPTARYTGGTTAEWGRKTTTA